VVVVTSTMVGDNDGAGVRWHVLAADVDNEGQGAVLQLIAAALRLRLADADADGVGYSRGRAGHRAQPVQVQLRQLRLITSSRHMLTSPSLCVQSAPQSLRRHHHVAQVYITPNPYHIVSVSAPCRGTYLDQTHVLCVACAALALAAVLQVCLPLSSLWPALLPLNML
jgi:hypothetical protein